MRFIWPVEFEIPDEWWAAADMSGFSPNMSAYRVSSSAEFATAIVPVGEIDPPSRVPGKQWFVRHRMIDVLRGIRAGDELPPVPVHEPPGQPVFRYAVRDGMHRLYASAAAGFKFLPVTILP